MAIRGYRILSPDHQKVWLEGATVMPGQGYVDNADWIANEGPYSGTTYFDLEEARKRLAEVIEKTPEREVNGEMRSCELQTMWDGSVRNTEDVVTEARRQKAEDAQDVQGGPFTVVIPATFDSEGEAKVIVNALAGLVDAEIREREVIWREGDPLPELNLQPVELHPDQIEQDRLVVETLERLGFSVAYPPQAVETAARALARATMAATREAQAKENDGRHD